MLKITVLMPIAFYFIWLWRVIIDCDSFFWLLCFSCISRRNLRNTEKPKHCDGHSGSDRRLFNFHFVWLLQQGSKVLCQIRLNSVFTIIQYISDDYLIGGFDRGCEWQAQLQLIRLINPLLAVYYALAAWRADPSLCAVNTLFSSSMLRCLFFFLCVRFPIMFYHRKLAMSGSNKVTSFCNFYFLTRCTAFLQDHALSHSYPSGLKP